MNEYLDRRSHPGFGGSDTSVCAFPHPLLYVIQSTELSNAAWCRFKNHRTMIAHMQHCHGGGGRAQHDDGVGLMINAGDGVAVGGGTVYPTDHKRLRSNDADGDRRHIPEEPTAPTSSASGLQLPMHVEVELNLGVADGPYRPQQQHPSNDLHGAPHAAELTSSLSEVEDLFSKVDLSFGHLVNVLLIRKLSM